jgi:hypothetical protein
MPISLYVARIADGAAPMNRWESMLAEPLGTADSVKAAVAALWPGLQWDAAADRWSARGEDRAARRHIEVSIANDVAGQCHFIVFRATPPSVIRQTMAALDLNYVCDPEAGCLVDPHGYDDEARYYAKKPWPPATDGPGG